MFARLSHGRLNFGAQIFTILVTVFGQLLLTPALIRIWGLELFGVWAVIAAVPYALQIFDFGIGVSAAPDISRDIHRQDFANAQRLFSRALSSCAIINAGLLLALAGLCGIIGLFHPVTLKGTSSFAGSVVVIFSIFGYFSVGLYTSISNSIFRMSDHQWMGSLVYDIGRGVEFLAVGVAAYLGFGVEVAIFSMFFFRAIFGIISFGFLIRKFSMLKPGLSRVDPSQFVRVIKEGLKSSSLAIANITSIQAPVIIASFFVSSEKIGIFVACRTLYRFSVQFFNAYIKSRIPVFYKINLNHGKIASIGKLKSDINFISALNILSMLILSILIEDIFHIWSGQRVEISFDTKMALSVMSVLYFYWQSICSVSIYIGMQQAVYRYIYLAIPISILAFFAILQAFPDNGLYFGSAVAELLFAVLAFLSIRSLARGRSVA